MKKLDRDNIDALIQTAKGKSPAKPKMVVATDAGISELEALKARVAELQAHRQATVTPIRKAAANATPEGYQPELDVQLDQIEVKGTTIVATLYSYNGGPCKIQLVRRFNGKWGKLGRISVKEVEALVANLREIERVHGEVDPVEEMGQP